MHIRLSRCREVGLPKPFTEKIASRLQSPAKSDRVFIAKMSFAKCPLVDT